MAKAKVFSGARAKVYVDGGQGPMLVGIFDSCSYSVNIGAEPIFTLGQYGPHEIAQTSYEAVTVNCSGFRVIGNGGHLLPKVPKLDDLLQLEGITLTMLDRQADANSEPILTVLNCIPVSYATGAQAKSTSRIQVTYVGTSASDESGPQSEGSEVTL